MAVSMNTSMRSDFMIGDAAISQRMAEFYEQQIQFAKVLGDVSGSKGGSADVMSEIRSALNEIREDERFQQALKALDREIGKESSVDGGILSKSTDKELPTDTNVLARMVVKGEIDVKDIPDELVTEALMDAIISLMIDLRLRGSIDEEEETEAIFDPAAAAVNEQNLSREVSSQMLSELYRIMEKHNEEQSEDEVTFLDGISEPIDETETLASVATEEVHAEESVEGVFEQIIDNMVEEAAQNEGTPVIQTQTDAVPTAGEAQNAAAQAAEELAEQAAETVQAGTQSDGAEMQFGGQDRQNEADEISNMIESFTAKEAEPRTENTPNASSEFTSRVKNASEELEMLKNAKLGKDENKPAETTTSLLSDQPIVFTRTDGSRIEIKPTEIVDQTMKIIQQAIEETREQSEYSLVLNPEELGRITVKLIKAADGAVSVTIAAENAHTQRVLEQHSELMQNNLRSNGVNLEHWQTVSESRQEAYAQDYSGSSKNPYFRNDDAQNDDEDNGDRTFADIIAAM